VDPATSANNPPPPSSQSHRPLTLSAAALLAAFEDTAAIEAVEAAEAEAVHEAAELTADIKFQETPECSVLHALPPHRMVLSDQVHETGKEPTPIFSFSYLRQCRACGAEHPNYVMNTSHYFMPPFLGPAVDMPTHSRRAIAPPTTFLHVDDYSSSNVTMNSTRYGHLIEGYYLSPIIFFFFDAPHMRREHHTVQLGTQARGSRCWTNPILSSSSSSSSSSPSSFSSFCSRFCFFFLFCFIIFLFFLFCFFIFIFFFFFEIKLLSRGFVPPRDHNFRNRPQSLHSPLERHQCYPCGR
jgi:hypothetical protein